MRGKEKKKKRRKEHQEHLGKSPEALFLGINLASCDPLSAVLAGSQLGPLESPGLFVWSLGICLEHRAGGTRLVFAGRIGLSSGHVEERGFAVLRPLGNFPPGLVGGQGSFPCFGGTLKGDVWTREQEEMQAGCLQD